MKVSIVTVVLNGEKTIGACIQSIAQQTYEDREHIIIDGGSTDRTIDIIKQYQNDIAYWSSETDEGLYHAMNKGINAANGDIVGILNSDDVYSDGKVIEKVVKTLSEDKALCCYGDLVYVDKDNMDRIIRRWKSQPYRDGLMKKGWMPPHPTFFVRREVYEKYGGFNTALGSAADYELMLRFLERHRISTAYIPEVMVKMRIGGISNASLKHRFMANRMDRLAWKVNDLKPYPWTLYLKPLRKIGQYFFHG